MEQVWFIGAFQSISRLISTLSGYKKNMGTYGLTLELCCPQGETEKPEGGGLAREENYSLLTSALKCTAGLWPKRAIFTRKSWM